MRKAAIVLCLIAVFCLALAGVAMAKGGGSNGTISGTVVDINTKAAIAGATVTDANRITATTDANGNYTMSVPVGADTLSVTAANYQQTWQICTVNAGATTTVNWSLTAAYPTNAPPAQPNGLVVMAWNDLGMHCDQDSYKYLCVLPPYNTLHVQIKDQNSKSGAMPSGLTVSYSFPKKTNSTLHTDFWTYSTSFGFLDPVTKQPLQPNEGLTGNYLSGTMVPDSNNKSWVATGIPITPYDDDGTWDPYGTATITVKNSSGVPVATQNVVAPVSTEMACSNCHGTTPFVDILSKHDSLNGTTLLNDANAGHPHLCAECHASNALGAPGKTGVEPLSYAMHNHHAGKVTDDTAGCYNCHPGAKTQCLRGIMSRAGKGCVDCHGTVANVASSQGPGGVGGRQAWLQEPQCGQCHDSKHAENSGTLYRNSLLLNGPSSSMNNIIYCEACHNGTHAEYTTSNASDTAVTQQIQGNNYWLYNCADCHPGKSIGNMHR